MAVMPVVAGADGSQDSLRAVQWAAREAGRHGRRCGSSPRPRCHRA